MNTTTPPPSSAAEWVGFFFSPGIVDVTTVPHDRECREAQSLNSQTVGTQSNCAVLVSSLFVRSVEDFGSR